MTNTIHDILKRYWGYSSFRSLQEDIISSVLDGRDTLALLPTGGGKSLCFQVPGLFKEGVCIVVSPLIALMKDQVAQLQEKGIAATAIISGMHKREIDIVLDNCVYGKYKFLYLSPERLESEIVIERIRKMQVNILAIDEAHCISQWGYDFRPSYLNIQSIREILPQTPVLALTATATQEVVKDIQKQLLFKKEHVLQAEFERPNLAYVVIHQEDKYKRLLNIIHRIPGSGIVYARNRKRTEEVAKWLQKEGIKADFYHAGLALNQRDEKQKNWIENKIKIIVATNAFGMGINKTDVRYVVHLDIPDSIENYFQEAGRAGRDEQKAYAVLLYNNSDLINLKNQVENLFVAKEDIKRVYHSLGNYFQLAIGSGKDCTFDFDISSFCAQYHFNSLMAYNSLRFLEKDKYIQISDSINSFSKINFLLNKQDLYRFQIEQEYYDNFIKLLLRSYSGIFDTYVKIDEAELARRYNSPRDTILKLLKKLHELKVISYVPKTTLPQLIFIKERISDLNFYISKEAYDDRKKIAFEKMESIKNYLTSNHLCRSYQLLYYFGQKNSQKCGVCDICIEERKKELSGDEFEKIAKTINQYLKESSYKTDDLIDKMINFKKENVIKVIQWLLDNDELMIQANMIYLSEK